MRKSTMDLLSTRIARPVAREVVDRRDFLRVAGAAGLGIAALRLGNRSTFARQDATPAATPQIGAQADGSTMWKVIVGGMEMDAPIEYHGFFPGELTINAGDSVWFSEAMPMFHTVTFPGAEEVPPIFITDPEVDASTPVAGPPKLIINPLLLSGTESWTVDGSALASTSLDIVADPTKPWVFTFPTAGTYEYLCVPHSSVMRAKIVVQEAGSALPLDQAGVDAAAAEQIAALHEQGLAELEKYASATSSTKDDGSTLWQVALGAGGKSQVRVQAYLPHDLEIKAGDSVKYVIQSEGEPHTVSLIGAGETPPEDSIIEAFADGSPKLVQNMQTFLPQGGNTWSGSGWLNSGFLGIPELGLPMEFEILFDTPGEYIPYCVLHGNAAGERMASKLTVTEA